MRIQNDKWKKSGTIKNNWNILNKKLNSWRAE